MVAARADLGDKLQGVWVGMQCLADELVDDVGSVELRGVDVVHPELERAPEHRTSRAGISRRSEDAGAGELHRAEADAPNGMGAEGSCLGGSHAHTLR